jgi:hypothetical protein
MPGETYNLGDIPAIKVLINAILHSNLSHACMHTGTYTHTHAGTHTQAHKNTNGSAHAHTNKEMHVYVYR